MQQSMILESNNDNEMLNEMLNEGWKVISMCSLVPSVSMGARHVAKVSGGRALVILEKKGEKWIQGKEDRLPLEPVVEG